MAPADGGRRSRRGYAYQDAITLLDCLDMHSGHFNEVGFEDLDDIVCVSNGQTIYRQVKTKEDSTRHSIATVCREEKKGKAETSILGRLFLGKPVDNNPRFCLVLNETPTPDLGSFIAQRGEARGEASSEPCSDIATRLKHLPLSNGCTIDWYIGRFEVLVESRTIEEVEANLLTRLAEPIAKLMGGQPLLSEIDDVLIKLNHHVARDAQARKPKRWDADYFTSVLQREVTRATGRKADGSIEPLEPLTGKLKTAGVPAQEVQAQLEAMLGYRRRYRSAVGQERSLFDTINDHVFAICSTISAQRRSGLIADGPAAYAATVSAVAEMQIPGHSSVPLPDKLASLSDVTARCQNRYADAS